AEVTTVSSTGTPSLRPSSRARSTETPRGSPVGESRVARTGLPTLIAARSLPVGASSAAGGAKAQAASMAASTTAAVRWKVVSIVMPGDCSLHLACMQGSRYDTIDALRGAAIVWMTVFHFCFDLNHFGWIRQDFYRDPAWTLQRT